MQSSSKKSVKLPMFDGMPKNFQIWWMRLIAYAIIFKFNKVISKDVPDPDMPQSEVEVLDESNDAHKKKIVVKNHNAVAMANLLMPFTSEGTMGLVYKAMSTDWPNGLAQLVVKGLFKKYQPQDTVNLHQSTHLCHFVIMSEFFLIFMFFSHNSCGHTS